MVYHRFFLFFLKKKRIILFYGYLSGAFSTSLSLLEYANILIGEIVFFYGRAFKTYAKIFSLRVIVTLDTHALYSLQPSVYRGIGISSPISGVRS